MIRQYKTIRHNIIQYIVRQAGALEYDLRQNKTVQDNTKQDTHIAIEYNIRSGKLVQSKQIQCKTIPCNLRQHQTRR